MVEIEGSEHTQTIKTSGQFYADDGYIAGVDGERVQTVMTNITQHFKCLGLRMNHTKTKMLIGRIGNVQVNISNHAYQRRLTGTGSSYRERMAEPITCPEPDCEKILQRRRLKDHLLLDHNSSNNRTPSAEIRPPIGDYTWEVGDFCPVEGCGYPPHVLI